jgi:hypothetical protein
MHSELADAIERMAAPIYAALLAHYLSLARGSGMPSQETLATLRFAAIDHAMALHREVLLTPGKD